MKSLWGKKICAFMLCAAMLATSGIFTLTAKADPDVPKILENYVDSLVFLAGEDRDLLTNYVNKEIVYNLEDVPANAYLGYYQADLDKDGQEELLLISVDDTLARNICLSIVEVVGYEAKKTVSVNVGKTIADVWNLKFPIAVEGTTSSYMDWFVYELEGKPAIMAELYWLGDVPEFLHHQYYACWTYDGKKLEKKAAHGMWWESDHSPDFVMDLPNIGVDTKDHFYDWRAGELKLGNFLIDKGYVNVCRVEAIPEMEKEEAESFFKVNHGWLDGRKGATLRFTMPRIREVIPMDDEKRLDINMLLSGLTATNKTYVSKVEDWDTEKRLDYIYTLLNKDLPESFMVQNPDIYPQRKNMYDYGYASESTDLGPSYSYMVLNALAEAIFGESFDFPVKNRKLTPGLETNEQFLYVMPSGGYSTLMLADTMYRENEHLFVTGSAYENATTTVYLGRFLVELYDFPYSMFGYSLVSYNGITPPKTVPMVSATASSSVPDEGEEFQYGPEMAVDGDLKTAWNEGAAGTGEGEWISLNMPMALDTLVTSIRVVNGYQKTEETFDNNGYVVRARLEFSDGTSLESYLGYEDAVIFEKPVYTSFVKLVILEATAGEKYNDTCITEIEVFTGDDVLWTLPLPYKMIDAKGMIGLDEDGNPVMGQGYEWGSAGFVHVYGGDYILPASNLRYYEAYELKGLSKEDLRYARNEIYARHGRRFASADLQAYFDAKAWYKGTIDANKFDDKVLSKIELANIKLIEDVENGKIVP